MWRTFLFSCQSLRSCRISWKSPIPWPKKNFPPKWETVPPSILLRTTFHSIGVKHFLEIAESPNFYAFIYLRRAKNYCDFRKNLIPLCGIDFILIEKKIPGDSTNSQLQFKADQGVIYVLWKLKNFFRKFWLKNTMEKKRNNDNPFLRRPKSYSVRITMQRPCCCQNESIKSLNETFTVRRLRHFTYVT